jgi:hypothetical protein
LWPVNHRGAIMGRRRSGNLFALAIPGMAAAMAFAGND